MFAFGVGAFGKIQFRGNLFIGDNPTTTDILGPFYRPNAPFRTNLNPPGYQGKVFHFSGSIYKSDGKTPFADALVEIWQCDEHEVYDNTSDDFEYRASQKTKSNGKYNFTTTHPIPYRFSPDSPNYRPAHIHMRISGEKQQDLITQVYFKNDPHLDKDAYASSPEAINRILPISVSNSGEERVQFDIVMAKEFMPEASVFQRISGIYDMSNGSLDEFYRNGDSLFRKRNGQIDSAFLFTGNNEFKSASGNRLRFELLKGGNVKVCYINKDGVCDISGMKTFKY